MIKRVRRYDDAVFTNPPEDIMSKTSGKWITDNLYNLIKKYIISLHRLLNHKQIRRNLSS